mmetsp:Transcript_3375/g.5666  ORF Transcript_3375/g.5666 Transcript_3375/m.5666 type:complete len:209 (+) Transcript_3375:505-1131(+)
MNLPIQRQQEAGPKAENLQSSNQSHKRFNMAEVQERLQHQVQLMMISAKREGAKGKQASTESQFKVEGDLDFVQKTDDFRIINDFMDKKIDLQPAELIKRLDSFFKDFMGNPQMESFKRQMVSTMLALGLMSSAAIGPAFAENEAPQLPPPDGITSYTNFIRGVKDHQIERVKVAFDGKEADFLNEMGQRGHVALFNDPNLLQMLKDN